MGFPAGLRRLFKRLHAVDQVPEILFPLLANEYGIFELATDLPLFLRDFTGLLQGVVTEGSDSKLFQLASAILGFPPVPKGPVLCHLGDALALLRGLPLLDAIHADLAYLEIEPAALVIAERPRLMPRGERSRLEYRPLPGAFNLGHNTPQPAPGVHTSIHTVNQNPTKFKINKSYKYNLDKRIISNNSTL